MTILRYTTDQLIESVRQRARLPDVGALGSTDENIISTLTECLRSMVLPGIIKVNEEFGVITRRTPTVAAQSRYRIPGRASGLRLRDLTFVGSDGTRYPLIQLKRKELVSMGTYNSATRPYQYYLEGAYIVLWPDVDSTWDAGFIEFAYYPRPGDLVLESEARQITAIDPVGGVLSSATNFPLSWLAAGPYDIHSQESGAELKALEFAATAILDTSMTVSLDIVNGVAFGSLPIQVGDWIVKSGEAVIPAIPTEIQVALSRAAAATMMGPIDPDAASGCWDEFKLAMQQAGYLADARIETSSKKVIVPNPAYGDYRRS